MYKRSVKWQRNKVLRLRQGSMTVEEYRQQMELLLLRAGLREDDSACMSKPLVYNFP